MSNDPIQPEPQKARVVGGWIDDAIEGLSEVYVPDVAAAIVARVKADHALLAAFCDRYLYQAVYGLCLQRVARRRDVRTVHGTPAPKPGTKAPAPKPIITWLDRYEHCRGRHMLLGDMTKKDLYDAAKERADMGLPSLLQAGLLEQLARLLPEGKKVRERFTDDEIARWARMLKVEWKASIPVPKKKAPEPPTDPEKEVAD